ncbi:TPR-like protein [Suillus placidus]|uniref:TPR-like protein n=1 Tax=Suillus placidus TaxID=48579 RepID=A0A9P6ZKB1_9AGAM|nr:TPR-like protein [Suillus placidus]
MSGGLEEMSPWPFSSITSLDNLANGLHSRFTQRGVPSDLDECIELHHAALLLRPSSHSDRSASLNNLAVSLRDRFRQRGVPSDLDEAIKLNRAALLLRPLGHSDHLASSLAARFKQWGVPSDLDEWIELNRAALLLRPPGHSDRSASLNNLAISLRERFTQQGIPSDLDECIKLLWAALVLCPSGHSLRPSSLNNIAVSLRDRFKQWGVPSDLDESSSLSNLTSSLRDRFTQRGIPSDLDESIELHRAALLLCPPGHSDRSLSLNNLTISLRDRFMQQGIPSDLDECIKFNQAALILHPPGHSDRSSSLNNLASSLGARFTQRGIPSDLDEYIELHRAALILRPHGHSDRSQSLNNLANSLQNRFTQWGVPSDLDECIELNQAALLLRPPGHFNRSSSLNHLASSLRGRFTQRGVPSDLDETFSLFLQLSHTSHAVSRMDLTAAKSWATAAEETNHGSALVAYQTALKFLDQHVALLSSLSRHFDVMRMATASLAVDAFSCSNWWSKAVQYSGPSWHASAQPLMNFLWIVTPGAALAEEFEQLSFRLCNAFDQSTEYQSPKIRQLTMQWDDVVSRIRMLPDFSQFLLPPLFSDLQKAAEEGPVIIVNASQYSCDALIVLSYQDPVHVPIDITQTEVSDLSSEFQSLSKKFGSFDNQHKLVSILRKLWHVIVDPVVQALRVSNIHPGSHIWWCPTAEFTLLPLHAAGLYEKKRDRLSHMYISSYTPALATLVHARQQRLMPIVSSFVSLEDNDATVEGALDALNHNQWLHLACHGMPNRQQPFESSFTMRDGPLMIKDIIRSNWQKPEFAFLSACHTTVGDEKSPDESIHLAAAMQFSGFCSVIDSMWSVDDEVAQQVVSAFYEKLVDDSGRLDCTARCGGVAQGCEEIAAQ